jgi:hypothetical protein
MYRFHFADLQQTSDHKKRMIREQAWMKQVTSLSISFQSTISKRK